MKHSRIPPVHPGFYLKELIEELDITQNRLAASISVTPMRISHIIHGKRPVTAELALRLGLFFGQSPQYWLNLQSRYDMDTAQDALEGRLSREVIPFRKVA